MKIFAGRYWNYDFREINSAFSHKSCARISASLLQRYSKLTKTWSREANSEWICKLYMAAKLIMSATLHINAVYFAQDKNLRVVVPYLRYYAVFSLLRAVCYTLPEHRWQDGQLIKIQHNDAIKSVLRYLECFDKTASEITKNAIYELKAEREFVSYRAPSSGDAQISEKNRYLSLCMLLAEVAQFNSELFEVSLIKHANPDCFFLIPDYAAKIASMEIDGHFFGDTQDAYRLNYIARKQPYPVNIQQFMRQGHVEDFFGAWSTEEESHEQFNPDEMNNIIFDIP